MGMDISLDLILASAMPIVLVMPLCAVHF